MRTFIRTSVLFFILGFLPLTASAAETWWTCTACNGEAIDTVARLGVSPDGGLWSAMRIKGNWTVARMTGTTWKTVKGEDGVTPHFFMASAISFDADGRPLVGYMGGLARFDGHNWKIFSAYDGIEGYNNTYSVAVAPNGDIWSGTDFGYVSQMHDGVWKPHHVSDVFNWAGSISIMPDGTVWVGLSQDKLYRLTGSTWQAVELPGGFGTWTAIDKSGALWAAVGDGVARLDSTGWKTYTSADGLAQGSVNGITAAPDGSVWVATEAGASQFRDGIWKTYTAADGLLSDTVRSIAAGSDGLVWFGTEKGLTRLDPSGRLPGGSGETVDPGGSDPGDDPAPTDPITVVPTPVSLEEYDQRSLQKPTYKQFIVESGGYIWYGTQTGLCRKNISTGEVRSFASVDGVSTVSVSLIEKAPNGDIWIALGSDPARFDGVSWKRFTASDGVPQNGISIMKTVPNGDVWIASGSVAARYNGTSWKVYSASDGLTGTLVTALGAAPNGDIWLGTAGENGGISRFDGVSWKTFTKADGLIAARSEYAFNGYCTSIAFGPDGVVWVVSTGTSAVGEKMNWYSYDNSTVSSFDGTRWTKRGDFDSRQINRIEVGRDGMVWTGSSAYEGSGGGVSVFDGTAWNKLESTSYYHTIAPMSIRSGPDGMIWIALPGKGMFLQDGTGLRNFTAAEGLASDVAYDITWTSDGSAWVMTAEGHCRFTGTKWEPVDRYEGLVSNSFRCLAVDTKGNLWGGSSGGVVRFDGTRWTMSLKADNGENPSILAVDGDGKSVWAGFSNTDGFWRYDGASWKKTGSMDGMPVIDPYIVLVMAPYPDNGIIAAVFDDRNDSYYSPEEVKFVSLHNGAWETYGLPNGLKFITITPEGTHWYATETNLNWYASGKSGSALVGKDIPGTKITALASGPGGRTWVGTDAGISTFNGNRWTHYTINQPASTITVDCYGKAWIGSPGVVYCTDGTSWRKFTPAEGLVSANVTSIASGPDGTVYIGTDNGISILNPKSSSVGSDQSIPLPLSIRGNHPNPFNPATVISYTLPRNGDAVLTIYNIAGQKVRTLVAGKMTAGAHSTRWNGRDDAGRMVSSGVYIAHLRAGNAVSSRKMLLMK